MKTIVLDMQPDHKNTYAMAGVAESSSGPHGQVQINVAKRLDCWVTAPERKLVLALSKSTTKYQADDAGHYGDRCNLQQRKLKRVIFEFEDSEAETRADGMYVECDSLKVCGVQVHGPFGTLDDARAHIKTLVCTQADVVLIKDHETIDRVNMYPF